MGRNYEDDFASSELVELEVEGFENGDFLYQPVTAEMENLWVSECTSRDKETGEIIQDLSEVNKRRIALLHKVPYSRELIKKRTKLDKEWSELGVDHKWDFLKGLKPVRFNAIISAMVNFDNGDGEAKKKS